MHKAEQNHQQRDELRRFVDAPELSPRHGTEDAVMRRARAGQRPSPRAVVAKFLAIQLSSGLVTLTICSQFGIGLGHHNSVLHSLHAHGHPALYYLSCGGLFVLFGALFNGLVANRRELKAIGHGKYLFFGSYSLCAYLALLLSGTESFLLISLFWILGGVAAHLIGFALGWKLRTLSL
ncbi:MAG: hypothetical protein R6W66_03180 [Pelovirga sp.]